MSNSLQFSKPISRDGQYSKQKLLYCMNKDKMWITDNDHTSFGPLIPHTEQGDTRQAANQASLVSITLKESTCEQHCTRLPFATVNLVYFSSCVIWNIQSTTSTTCTDDQHHQHQHPHLAQHPKNGAHRWQVYTGQGIARG